MKNVTWITSVNQRMYENEIYGKCLQSWHLLPGEKILFSEDGFKLDDFKNFDLRPLIDNSQYLKKRKSKQATRLYYKALAIYHSLKNFNNDFIVWLDSDIEILKELDIFPEIKSEYASMFYPFPENHKLEKSTHDYGVDTGILIFNMNKLNRDFADNFINYWEKYQIENLEREKDTWVLCDMNKYHQWSNLMLEYKELPPGTNYFDFTIFKKYFYHYIGRGQKNVN
jgi:hypothetical protein